MEEEKQTYGRSFVEALTALLEARHAMYQTDRDSPLMKEQFKNLAECEDALAQEIDDIMHFCVDE